MLHIGNNNQYTKYIINGSELSKVNHEKNFEVIISNDLKPSKHCSDVKITNKLVGFTGRTSENKSEKVILTLFTALVLPHLEYILIRWKKYKKKLPAKSSHYEKRLKELNLFSLSKRRLRGDLIKLFEIFHGFDNI